MQNITTAPSQSHAGEALPGYIVDMIFTGLSDKQLRGDGRYPGIAVWCAVRRTAASAYARGWTRHRWVSFLADDRNLLWWQLKVSNPLRPKSREMRRVFRDLDRAWESAAKYVDSENADPEVLIAEAKRRANALVKLVQQRGSELTYTERSVLLFAAYCTRKRGWLKVTLPSRVVGLAVGRSAVAANKVLRHLARKGFLNQIARGRAGTKVNGGSGAAAIYEIPIDIGSYLRKDEIDETEDVFDRLGVVAGSGLSAEDVAALPQGGGVPWPGYEDPGLRRRGPGALSVV